ncbi:hypothetical protein WJX72_000720 [[Myrmecia] bisecta]|uniref:peptidylprolyl isomerase n=1 Tax=[Myrmecia] bisecta TaxID=41462 RepID=A0AAW1Q704_9CHLO
MATSIAGCSTSLRAPSRVCSLHTRKQPRLCTARPVTCRADGDREHYHQAHTLADMLRNCAIGLAAAASVALPATFAPPEVMPTAQAGLLNADPVKNARALLRNALPIQNKPVRTIQVELESISEALRIPGSKSLGPIAKSVRKAENTLGKERQRIVEAFAPDKKEAGMAALANLDRSFAEFDKIIESGDKQEVPIKQQEVLGYVGQVEEAMVKGFPFTVPSQYANLPQLKGRATIDMKIRLKETRLNGVTGGTMKIVVDGYNAPVTAGNFVDLVQRQFYDGMEIQRADGFVVQTGDPDGDAEGFVDPKTGEIRRIPFEIMVQGDKEPVYEENLEDSGRFNEQPVLPFNAYGTLALARAEFDTNSGSSQVFFLLKESELTPTGSNLLDGRYAVFGYVTEGQDLLQEMQVGDLIESAKVVDGLEYLQEPASA